MDSVESSITESIINWDNEKKSKLLLTEVLDEKDEKKNGVSSESSCYKSPLNSKKYKSKGKKWEMCRIEDDILKDLPNSESIIKILLNGNLDDLESDDINSALLLSILMGRSEYVTRIVHTYYADVNATDKNGRSALHLACSTGNANITQLLIDYGANVNKWDQAKKFAPLHCAANASNIDCIKCLLDNGASVNAGIEKRSALQIAIEKNSIACVELLLKYNANPSTPQVYTETPLHTAAALGNLECMKLLLAHKADVRSQFGKKRMTALHLAAERNHSDCVKLLLKHDADINVRNAENQTPLHLACLSQCAETVDLLIENGADVNATYKDGRTALHAAIVKESKSLDCTRALLCAGARVNIADNYGYTPLHIAALNESSACAYLLIEHGADITARTSNGITALSFIVRRTREVIPKFLAKFDSSIEVNEHEIGDVDCEIKLDFRLLVPNTERGETELLLSFIEVGQKRVLKHPLCETFLCLKWRRIRKFFLFSLFYHAIYVLLFTILILGIYNKECRKVERDENNLELDRNCETPCYVEPLGYIVIFMNLLLFAKEFFQMGHGFINYAKYWENWIQCAIILGVFLCSTPVTIFSDNLKNSPDWQHHIAAIIIFLIWIELMTIVGRFPIFGLYIQMFTKVAMNFAKFLLAHCCLLIAFGLSFKVLFDSYPAFKSIPWTLVKTITMMAGELEFEDIFYGDIPIRFPITSHIMFFSFVVLVTIILTNLLVGLAVNDIQGIQASAGLDRLTRQVELVSRLESLFFSKLLRKAPPSLVRMCQRSALLSTSKYRLQFCVRPNDPRDSRLPKDLVLNIYKLVADRRDISMKRIQREQNFSYFTNSINSDLDVGIQLRHMQEMFNRKMEEILKEIGLLSQKLDK